MSRAIAVFVTLIFLVLAAFAFLSIRPVSLPKTLTPVAEWFDERRSGQASRADATQSTMTQSAPVEDRKLTPRESTTVSSSTLTNRSAVAEVTVDNKGGQTVKPATTTSIANNQQSPAHAESNGAASDPAQSVNVDRATGTSGQAPSQSTLGQTRRSAGAAASERSAPLGPIAPVSAAKTKVLSQIEVSDKSDINLAAPGQAITGPSNSGQVGAAPAPFEASAATDRLAAMAARAAQRARAVAISENNSTATSRGQAGVGASNASAEASPFSVPTPVTAPATARDAVAMIDPGVTTPRPKTVDAVRQQRSIVNFLAGKIVEFQVGRDVLTPAGSRVLDRLVPIIQANSGTVITIQGHTDDVGDETSNLSLSRARALAARSYLINKGIAPRRLRVQGLGERFPIADNNSESGRIRNRRIDFAVSDAAG